MANEQIAAVIVSYNPDVDSFIKMLEVLLPQVNYAILVNNSPSFYISPVAQEFSDENIELLQMSENIGIAAAQNAGIERAVVLGADYILLLDQDSLPSNSLVAELLDAIVSVRDVGVAAVGPVIVDRRTEKMYHFMIDYMGGPRRVIPVRNSSAIEVAILPSSGTLIPVSVLKKIGGMRSDYFIDHVDSEWSSRARAKGYKLLGIPRTTLKHQFGDAVKKIWFFGWRDVIFHSPLRNYYDVRNTLLMLDGSNMPIKWKIYFLRRILRLWYFLFFSNDRWLRFGLIFLGIVHGLKGVSGRLQPVGGQCSTMPVSKIDPF